MNDLEVWAEHHLSQELLCQVRTRTRMAVVQRMIDNAIALTKQIPASETCAIEIFNRTISQLRQEVEHLTEYLGGV